MDRYVVKDATGQALAYVYARETKSDADIAKVLTMDEARGEQYCQAADAVAEDLGAVTRSAPVKFRPHNQGLAGA